MKISSNMPGARYFSYSLWRAWVLVAYTAPLWSRYGAGAEHDAWSAMYLWSTLAFAVIAVLLAVKHERAARLLADQRAVIACGALATLGMLTEYAALAIAPSSIGALFIAGAIATGIGTAPIALRSGCIYVAASSGAALTYTALSESFAGLIYFLVVGTVPWAALTIGATLPLLASLMSLFEGPESGYDAYGEANVSVDRKSLAIFIRFLCMVFLLTFTASFMRAIFNADADEAAIINGSAPGLTFVVMLAFALALVGSVLKEFNFGTIYYPLVLALAASLAFVFASSGPHMGYVQSVSTAVYSLFSMFMWCILTYVARSALLDPVQTFGFGRAAFAAGSLLGAMLGQRNLAALFGNPDSATTAGGLLAFMLIAAAMFLFRERDIDLLSRKLTVIDESEVKGSYHEAQKRSPYEPSRSSEHLDSDPNIIDPMSFADEHGLTAREREVLLLMLGGADSRTISERLIISNNTAKAHIRNIYLKTDVRTRKEFIAATALVRKP